MPATGSLTHAFGAGHRDFPYGNNYFIGSRTLSYPVPLYGILCDSNGSISTSRRKAAASSGLTGLM